jgi:glutaredoxin 3
MGRTGSPTVMEDTMAKTAVLYRMVLPDHTCPFGVRAKQMLEDAGFDVEDNVLTSREEVDEFEEEQAVDTTPLIFIDDEPIGGSDDLERYLAAAN